MQNRQQREISELHGLLYEENQARMKIQMELDSKSAEIEHLQQRLHSVSNSETASIGSGQDGDFDENLSGSSSPLRLG